MSHGYFWLRPTIGMEDPPSIIIPYNHPTRIGCIQVYSLDKDVDLETHSGTESDAVGIATLCLSLDEDLEPLRKIAKTDDKWKWLIDEKKGRFLRSPSLFEDCCKAIFTINTKWKRSVQMAEAATEEFGVSTKAKLYGKAINAFPLPKQLRLENESTIKEALKCGFRAKFLLSLCDAAMEKPEIYLGNAWRNLSSDEFCAEIGSVSGLGPMSVAYVSRLYGKTNSYHMDSWVVRRCSELWGLSENQIEDYAKDRYGDFGEYGPAVFWFELTRSWHYSDDEAFEMGV
jgi:3-methyladenine DNA glycosylase/8-oxoguanine DNA glycosylase